MYTQGDAMTVLINKGGSSFMDVYNGLLSELTCMLAVCYHVSILLWDQDSRVRDLVANFINPRL